MAVSSRGIERHADLVVVGGGAGGLAAARAGARRGARVLLVQRGPLGGDCTFTGCVPSKALIEAAHRGDAFDRAIAAARRAVEVVAAIETDEVLRREGVDVLHGWATFREPGVLDVDGVVVRARRVVVATGASPALPPIDGLDDIDFLTNETVWDLDASPTSLAVLGGGAVGSELAQAFARLGSTVTVIEGLDRILPREDPEVSAVITEALSASGVAIRTGQVVERIAPLDPKGSVRLDLADGSTVEAERLLVAVGRAGAFDGLGLEAAGVGTARGYITTDETLATTTKGVWAVGDVTGRLQFTHAADEMGRIAAANALGRTGRRRFRTGSVPWVTFTDPEVAQVGMTEAEAADRGGRVAYLPMSEVDRAIAAHETLGFVKLITGPRHLLRNAGGGRVLGATIVASRAGEMIHEPALAMRTGMFAGRLAQTMHAYPTWSVAVRQAAAQFFMETGGRQARAARR
jgi:pyruvate/2-oxoglutarate dehydrogenase complex dihydrolipoamide dehydrogenase (E3) component